MILLRPAEPQDLAALWPLERDLFGADAWSEAQLREELTAAYRSYVVLVDTGGASEQRSLGSTQDGSTQDGSAPHGTAQEASRVIGYAGLFRPGSEADIQTIAVSPEYRGRGLGRVLMDALLNEAEERGVREVFLEVRADNPAAHALYRSQGFQDLAVRPKYYQPEGVDAIVMRLRMAERLRAGSGIPGPHTMQEDTKETLDD